MNMNPLWAPKKKPLTSIEKYVKRVETNQEESFFATSAGSTPSSRIFDMVSC